MKNRNVCFALGVLGSLFFSLPLFAQTETTTVAGMAWVNKVGARQTPSSQKIYKANKYGAVNDTVKLSTKGIQAAIDDCAKKGGGIVSFEPGIYLSGSLFIKSGVHLVIDKAVEIRG